MLKIRIEEKPTWYRRRHLAMSLLPVFESGVNFQAESSFWVSSNFDFVACSSFRSFSINKLTAGSRSADFKAAGPGACEDLYAAIWF